MSQTACPCVKKHAPPYWEGNVHHVVPQSWGGQTVPENLVDICMNTHGNTHNGLNVIVHVAWEENTTGTLTKRQLATAIAPYPRYVRGLIRRAVDGVGWKIPHVYTTHHPKPD